jgi:polyhydroxyalkanoate synthesis regulator protein
MTTKAKTKRTRTQATPLEGGKGSPRVIRKYPNRRLYDTIESRYVTLADIRRLVIERIDFVVLDRKSQQDITRSILLQVIRTYGSGLQDFVGRYLDESIQQFAREQRELRERFKNVVGVDPVETVTAVAQKNYQRWKALQEEVFSRLPRPWGRDE